MKMHTVCLTALMALCLSVNAFAGSLNVVYPEDFGAMGNDTVDDAAAINAAIAAAGPAGTVHLSLDNYYCRQTIVVPNGARFQYTNTPVIRPSIAHVAATDGIRYDGVGNVKTSLPILYGFSGTAIEIRNAGVINMDVQQIYTCGKALKLNCTSTAGTGTNTVAIQFISACINGIFITTDNSASVRPMQGNRVFVNFFTGTEAVVWDNLSNSPSWDTNTFHFGSIDTVNVANGRGFANKSPNPVAANVLVCENWFGGINQTSGRYFSGRFDSCEFKYHLGDIPTDYNTFSAVGNANRFIEVGGGGNLAAGSANLQTVANNRTAFGFGGLVPHNRIKAGLVLPANIPAGSSAVFYAYSPLLDGNSNTGSLKN